MASPLTGLRHLIVALLLVLWPACVMPARAAEPQLRDPIFGLVLKEGSPPFEPVRADLFDRCPDMVNQHWTRTAWTFAHLTRGDTAYLAVGGYFVNRATHERQQDWKGVLLALSPNGCTLIGPPREVLDYGASDFDDPLRHAFAQAAVEQYGVVLGGLPHLAAALSGQHLLPLPPQSGVLAAALADAGVH